MPVNFQLSKYQDAEWAKLKQEEQTLDLKEDMDPTFRMQKQRYELTKAYAEMMYEADPKWQQAKYQLEIGDCEAEFSKYSDPKF